MERSLVSVLVVDDFIPFRSFICSTLATRVNLLVSGEASDGLEAVHKTGSAQESGKSCDLRGFSSLFDLTAAVAVAVGMWKPVSLAGFQAPRASRTVSAELPSSRPRSVISTARPQFIGHSGQNVSFGRPASGNKCLSETRVECTFLQILAQIPKSLLSFWMRLFRGGNLRSKTIYSTGII